MARTRAGHVPPVAVRFEAPSVARVNDYYLGGSANWLIDREFGRFVLDRFPIMRQIALMHREFLTRVVRFLSRQGVHQFLDIGCGIPGHGSTHRIADNFALKKHQVLRSRVLYVDNDPITVGQGELLLSDYGDPRRHLMLERDVRDPHELWRDVVETGLFKVDEPIAVLLVGFLHLQQLDIYGNEIGALCVGKLCDLLPAGSYVALSHVTDDGVASYVSDALAGLKAVYDDAGSGAVTYRSRKEIGAMFDSLDILHPGWAPAMDWLPRYRDPYEPEPQIPPPNKSAIWAGVGHKRG